MSDQKNQKAENEGLAGKMIISEIEQDLLVKSAGGDVDAFTEFYKLKYKTIRRMTARICGENDADDIAQVAFLRLWEELPLIRDKSKVGCWLARVSANRAIDCLRHISRKKVISLSDFNEEKKETGFRAAYEKGNIKELFDLFSVSLGERQKVAFVLMALEGYSSIECAEIMEISDSTVRNLVRQARDLLRERITKVFPEYSREGKGKKNDE